MFVCGLVVCSRVALHKIGRPLLVSFTLRCSRSLFCTVASRAQPLRPPPNFRIRRFFPATPFSVCVFHVFHPGHAKLEVVSKLALPEPELQFSTNGDTSKGVVIGMGDVNIGIEEFNLLLEY